MKKIFKTVDDFSYSIDKVYLNKEKIEILGWCYSKSGIKRISVSINNVVIGCVLYGLYRNDVSLAYFDNGERLYSGFKFDKYYGNKIKITSKKNKLELKVDFLPFFTEEKKIIIEVEADLTNISNNSSILENNILFENTWNPQASNGVNLIAYFSSLLGLSITARDFSEVLKRINIPFNILDVKLANNREVNQEFDLPQINLIYNTNIFFINTDNLLRLYLANPAVFHNRRNILVWWWEYETGFEKYLSNIEFIDEILVFSDFVYHSIQKYLPHKKLIKTKYPFINSNEIYEKSDEIEKRLGLSNNDFKVFFNFDYCSSYQRKNPEAIIDSFYNGLSNENNVKCIIKTINADLYPNKSQLLQDKINSLKIADKVIIINEGMKRYEYMALLDSVNVYISLHRGEGLGLGMLEAMFKEKPVIATNYGGNTEFMNCENSFPINFKMEKSTDDNPAYSDVELWAEPDSEQAAGCLNHIYFNELETKSIAEKGKHYVEQLYDLDEISKEISDIFAICPNNKRNHIKSKQNKLKLPVESDYFIYSIDGINITDEYILLYGWALPKVNMEDYSVIIFFHTLWRNYFFSANKFSRPEIEIYKSDAIFNNNCGFYCLIESKYIFKFSNKIGILLTNIESKYYKKSKIKISNYLK